jgi:DNA-binding transcriptional regulator LsrR (DeoR family)
MSFITIQFTGGASIDVQGDAQEVADKIAASASRNSNYILVPEAAEGRDVYVFPSHVAAVVAHKS